MRDPAPALWAAAGVGWLLLVGVAVFAPGLAHDAHLLTADDTDGLLTAAGLLVIMMAWLVMVVAMMLPSTVPMMRMFTRVTADVGNRRRVRATFLLAYLAVWFGFAIAALIGSLAFQALVEHSWLGGRDDLVLALLLAVAAVGQFMPLTRRCLRVCRDPRTFLISHYRRGVGAAWALGVRHGLSCLGCCWALMLIMFATGVGSVWWMVALTAVMVAEKTTRWGTALVVPVGVVLLYASAVLALGDLAPEPLHDDPAAGLHPR
jgi:predicted metal-binding membrane protein